MDKSAVESSNHAVDTITGRNIFLQNGTFLNSIPTLKRKRAKYVYFTIHYIFLLKKYIDKDYRKIRDY